MTSPEFIIALLVIYFVVTFIIDVSIYLKTKKNIKNSKRK